MKLGIDIGGTSIKAGIIKDGPDIISIRSYPTEQTGKPHDLMNQTRIIIESYQSDFPEISSIGIGVPGVVDASGKVIIAPNIAGWQNVQFGAFLSSFLAIPFALDNDANAAALAELKLGAGLGYKDFLYMTLGTGVGGSIIYDSKIFKGENGGAGEFGHIIIHGNDYSDSIESYRQGTLEEYVGRAGIIRLARFLSTKHPRSNLVYLKNFDVKDIVEHASMGDELSIEVLERTGYLLGIGLSSIMNILDIPVVVIGGGISQAGEYLYKSINDTIKHRALPSISERSKIIKAKFTNDTGLIGAALLGGDSMSSFKSRITNEKQIYNKQTRM